MEKEELDKIKEQLVQQIDSWKASDEQKETAKKEIRDMPDDKFEEFLNKNKVLQEGSGCPFCMISEGKLDSQKIKENENAVAVLEINPLSKGHILVIPKKHIKESKEAEELAKEVSELLKEKLKPKDVKIFSKDIQGHLAINVVPDYGEKQERKKAEKEELEKIKENLLKVEEKIEKKEEKLEEFEKVPVRIP